MENEVEKLEREFAAWLPAVGSVAAGFGRSALVLALEAAGARGGEVAVPDFICAQVPEAVRRAGARPVFFRVQRDLSVRPEDFEAALTPQTRVAVVAHYFGRVQPAIRSLSEICRDHHLALVEDCALAFGDSYKGARAGTFGDAAVFSFTKSDWCYGGGIAATSSAELLNRLCALRAENFSEARKLSWLYGLLRRADFAANRPSRSRVAAVAGPVTQWLSGLGDDNFYNAGRFDTLLPAFAARRARRILADFKLDQLRRREITLRLKSALGETIHRVLFPDSEDAAESLEAAAFILVESPTGRAGEWVKRADREGVTLRLCWPAYQESEAEHASKLLAWLASHLVILEVHPRLCERDVERIAEVLRDLRTTA